MSDWTLVIGSNSFSGSSYCRYLLNQGVPVIGISRSPEAVYALAPHKWVKSDNFLFKQYDLNHQLTEIEQLLDRYKPKVVVNFAAQSMVGQSWEYPEHWFMTNCVSTIKLHNILRHKDYLDRYIHISTPEVYGSCSGYVTEEHALNPSTPYAVSRAACDMSLKTFFEVHKFPVITTRAANVYGPGQPLYRIIPKTIMSIVLGKRLPLHGGGLSERSFIHIDDVSRATQLIIEHGIVGDYYHISTNTTVTIRALVELICSKMNTKFEDVCEVVADRLGKDAAYLLDSQKLRHQTGWHDTVSLEQGLDQTIQWAMDNVVELKECPLDYIHKI